MLKFIRYSLFAVAVLLAAPACKKTVDQTGLDDAKKKAFQAQQKSKAAEAYRDIVEKYPDTEYAPLAKKQLERMGPVPTPIKKATPGK